MKYIRIGQVVTSKPRKNADEQCFSTSNGLKRVPRAGFEQSNKNTGNAATAGTGGNTGGDIEPNSDRYDAFCDQLKSWGFSGEQLVLIGDALRENGLEIVARQPASE